MTSRLVFFFYLIPRAQGCVKNQVYGFIIVVNVVLTWYTVPHKCLFIAQEHLLKRVLVSYW